MPTFQAIKLILDRLVLGKTAYLQDTHGKTFCWNTRTSLLAASVEVASGNYRLIDPSLIGNDQGDKTFLVKALRDPAGVDGNDQMPFEGNINGEYATVSELQTIIQWIDSNCPE
ncbi:MAG: hypothetical protein ABI073_06835 [Luteolibacter sp.]